MVFQVSAMAHGSQPLTDFIDISLQLGVVVDTVDLDDLGMIRPALLDLFFL